MADALAQTFQMSLSGALGVPGTYLTSMGIFFKNKSQTFGVSCVVYGTTNGYPDGSKIEGTGYLSPSQVNISDDGSAETKFLFSTPLMLKNNVMYAFCILPDAGSPDYDLFVSELGGTDLITGAFISTQPYAGTLFTTSNQTTFVPITTAEIKFNLYRAKFKYNQAQLVFRNQNTDYLTLTGYSRANTANPLQVGDEVYASNTANVAQILSNTAVYPFGRVFAADELSQKVQLIHTNGRFDPVSYPILNFFRIPQPGNTSLLTANNLIATANLVTIDDLSYHSIVPKFTLTEPTGSSVKMSYYATSNSYSAYTYDNFYESLSNEQRFDFSDYERSVRSFSNERASGSYGSNGTATVILNMATISPYSSPVIDLSTKTMLYITNQINNLADNEDTIYGDALNKYISQPVSMDITAEDLRFYLIGYRPIGTDILVYGRFRNNHDTSLIQDNPWSQLVLDQTQTNLYSSQKDKTDFQEYNFHVRTGNTVANQTIAYMDPAAQPQANTLTYYGTTGAQYVGFDNFQIKIVLLSQNQILYPFIKSISAIALLQ